MRLPKGFGKNYFTLAAIQASVSQNSLQATSVSIKNHHLYRICESEASEAETDDPLLLEPFLIVNTHKEAGQCNCYFKRLTQTRLRHNADENLFISTHLFTNSTISPPLAANILINTLY